MNTLTFRPVSEAFIRRKLVYSVLLDCSSTCIVLTDSRRVEKAVLRMAELISALLSIHGLWTFATDVYTFLDLPNGTIGFSITIAFDRSIIVLLNLPVYL